MKAYLISRNLGAAGRLLVLFVALGLPLGLPTTTKAAVTNLTGGAFVPLDFLITGNQAQVGDKLFSAFTFVANGDFPTNFNAHSLNVIGIQDTFGNFGIRYQGGISPNLGGSGDIFLTYTVDVTDPGFLISDLHLAYNGSQISAVIEQAFVSGNPNPVATLQVNNPPPVFHDMVLVTPPQQELQIQKDIFVRSLDGVTLISNIDQTFSQAQIPEPSTVVLVSTGLIGLLVFARRRDR
jgi:hypothetical protein